MRRTMTSLLTAMLVFCVAAFVAPVGVKAATTKAETVKVGAILAVTGGASFLGGPEARTIQMLADELNATGGINGNKIELIIKDSAGDPEKAISFAKQLIEE